ncbi:hypothetical protein A2926_02690 [Candidatus Giovannonibacteria bacterium RIFCSPLOWO2_01_FULL_44_40]|uniref:Uncharacterized protein n=1 Tax=Candidatus Giovannonibacteria bacterium RIFCSPHIGHO2_01_FULL_45_23 TaxID=1798325 RepID=A0A1F5VE56_9BACT|nr:MAG: hypothetical protein A2834_00815 [Candidatus Giovannonibacteria bacterium RIFCSPHIGHO2_01_FULL_45_23]OGF75749.1 MAG: hypothetical protein A3C77_02450 [Candidatus Giovannonibacteria bacterium RIFCSPHIGHO2_02_FULL_45_13]OGF79921.1 MAG: hypothetical protein A2926_02690 [Candidatus Giovannonibacteria bacterium RIFCSPLOWO2_01_FULL_44_40]
MRVKICSLCATVSGTWLLLTALILAGYLDAGIFMPLVLLLMGGTVVGIADRIKKQKPLIIGVGVVLAFLAARNLSFKILILEAAVILAFGYFLFLKQPKNNETANSKTRELEKQLKDCC